MHSTLKRIRRELLGEGLLLVLITVAAATLRLTAIDSLPPGLYHDEAYNGLDALQVLSGRYPIYFEANNGREPLFIYLLAASIAVWGRSPGALRLVSALAGTVAIPAIYWLARELYDRHVATVAAILAVTTVWTLNLSRVAFRAGLMLPLMALSLALLWRGLRLRRLSYMAGAGALYGLTFYTYLAARFSLVALLFFIIYIGLRDRQLLWLRGWGLFGLLGLVVVCPLGLYLVRNWSSALERSAQVSILNPAINGGDFWGTLMRHVWRTVRAFVYRGDFIPRHNVPFRPVFSPLIALAFWGGLGIAIWRARRCSANAFCVIWLGVMLLPTTLAEDALHMLRASGVLPVLLVFAALGLVEFWRLLSRRGASGAAGLLIGGALLASAGIDLRDYGRHVRSEAAYYNFEAGATEMAAEINRFLGSGWRGVGLDGQVQARVPGRQVHVASRLWRDWASLRFLCPDSEQLFVLPKDGAAASGDFSGESILLVLWPYEDNSKALRALPPSQLISVREGASERGDLEPSSRLLYVSYWSLPSGSVPRSVDVEWQGGVRLLGYHLVNVHDNDLTVELYWEAGQALDKSYTVFSHALCDGRLLGQHDGLPAQGYYPTVLWRAADIIEDRHTVSLSAPYQEGRCEVQVGLYDQGTMQRLALLDAEHQPTAQTSVALH